MEAKSQLHQVLLEATRTLLTFLTVNDINIWDMEKRSRICHLAEHTEIVSALVDHRPSNDVK